MSEITELYKNLENLQNLSDAFYSSEQDLTVKGITYTVKSFSYRLASYTDFKYPNAKDSRGTAFYTEKDKDDWKLFCRAYPKFWNLGESIPKEDYMKDNPTQECFNKLDGSLILVGSINGKLIAKSKTSLYSDQAELANSFLETHTQYRSFCEAMISEGYTPVFELIGKKNVIVIRYDVDFELVLLGIVNNKTGEITTFDELPAYSTIKIAESYDKTWDELLEIQENSQDNIEGFVVKSEKGLCKVKIQKYVQLHALKDSVNNTKALTNLILDDNLDDLISSFRDDKVTIDFILKAQEKISHRYNLLVKTVEEAYKKSKDLERKEYAILHQKTNKGIFGLLMAKYLGKEPDYKAFFMKNKMYE